MSTQLERAHAFRRLHAKPGCFLMPNPWDRGSAKILAKMGFPALATTSAGHAFSQGLLDGGITRQEALSHIALLSSATALPLSADLQHGYGDSPEECRQVILDAAAHGAVGASLEDTANGRSSGLYSPEAAADRIRAAVAAAESLPFPFTLTARAENFQVGLPDLRDTIRRLQAFQEAGAHVLFAPGVGTLNDMVDIVKSVDRPVSFMAAAANLPFDLNQLEQIGVKRVSVGGCFARAAYGEMVRAAQTLRDSSSFGYADTALPGARLAEYLG